MVYALNVFNLLADHEAEYRDYNLRGRVVAAGRDPLRQMHGDRSRRYLIVVEFPSEEVFQKFLDQAQEQGLHRLRESATTDYIWTLYQPWDLKAWVRQ